MTYHHGWMWLVQENGLAKEVFNHARTANYLASIGEIGCGKVYNILDMGGCDAYRYNPPCEEDGDVDWTAQEYVSPDIDEAPWHDLDWPESADALGFWIEEWTGLDSAHVRRGVQPIGGYRGGGQLNPMGAAHREMAFNVLLIGMSEKALEYLFRWLEATLMSVCQTCATDTILVRRFCPEMDDALDYGLVELREVGLMSGLQWASPPSVNNQCFLRRATFTLAAGDPCMYSPSTTQLMGPVASIATCLSNVVTGTTRGPCRPDCSEMDSSCFTWADFVVEEIGAAAPVVVFRNNTTEYTLQTRARIYANPLALTITEHCGMPLLAELYIRPLPPASELVWDGAGRKVTYRSTATGGEVNGYAYVDVNDVGVSRFAGLGCGLYMLTIDPGSLCIDNLDLFGSQYTDANGEVHTVPAGTWRDEYGFLYSNPSLPTVSFEMQERLGCP